MTTAADFSQIVLAALPFGGIATPCNELGEPYRAPGQTSRACRAVDLADAEHDDIVRVRFAPAGGPTTPGDSLTIYTTCPWTNLPDGAWVVPSVTPDGDLIEWYRISPFRSDP